MKESQYKTCSKEVANLHNMDNLDASLPTSNVFAPETAANRNRIEDPIKRNKTNINFVPQDYLNWLSKILHMLGYTNKLYLRSISGMEMLVDLFTKKPMNTEQIWLCVDIWW